LIAAACGTKQVRVPRPNDAVARSSELEGLASYYAEPYHGRRTASGEVFDTYEHMTAAHRTLPFQTVVKVVNTLNGRQVEVRINDRGPFVDGRVIDLSLRAAREIDMVRAGVVPVRLEIVREASAAGAQTPPAPSTLYTVQVAAFETEAAAENLRRRLSERYRDVTVQTFSSDRMFYRVRVGLSSDIGSAEELLRQLRQESLASFIVRLN
jgi:rare lipoprotein A